MNSGEQPAVIPAGLPRSLLIPVETTNREFDGKLLLALKALERGYEPILGSRTAMHAILPSFPRSIYLAKGARSGSERVFGMLEALGHIIVALDEEALVRFPDEAFHMKLDPATFNRPRLLYSWGRSNADVWSGFKDYGGAPILETGNPRVDMMRPEFRRFYADDCAAIRKEIGRYIMISSNFAFVNHFIPNHVRYRVRKTADKSKSEAVKTAFVRHKQALFEHFLDLVPKLASAIAPNSLLVRPHPSENAEAWVRAAQGLANVRVINRGPITPWLMASDALVHNGCTSAIEAALLGRMAFAYQPLTSGSDLALPNSLSIAYSDPEQLVGACRAVFDKDFVSCSGPTISQASILKHHIASLDGDLAVDRILDSFESFREKLVEARAVGASARWKALAGHVTREAYRTVVTRIKTSKSSASYTRHKFPEMTVEQVTDKAKRLANLAGTHVPAVRQISANVFGLSGKGGL